MKNLCFLCDKEITNNKMIAVNTLKHSGLKFNIKQRLEKFIENTNSIDIKNYNLKSIHLSCEEKIEKELDFKYE